jgi:hypothetical protein
MNRSLTADAAADAALREALLREFPTLADDEPALLDTLDGISDFPERCRALIVSSFDDETMAEALAARVKKMASRKSRLEDRAARKKYLVQAAMETAARRRFDFPEATVTLTKGSRHVIVTDEKALPDAYVKIIRKPIKADIKTALEGGDEVPGAVLSNPAPTISIRQG